MTDDLARVVRAARTPYGYTLATWGAGILCIDIYGLPGLGGVLLFIGGGTAAVGIVTWTVRNRVPAAEAPKTPLAATHFGALGVSTITAWIVAETLPAPWGWFGSSAACTTVFLVLHSAQDSAARAYGSESHEIGPVDVHLPPA